MKLLLIRQTSQWLINIYRGQGPFFRLNKIIPDFEIVEPQYQHLIEQQEEGEPWQDVLNCDAAYFLRTADPDSLAIGRFCKRVGIPVWYDIDDDLFNVNPDSKAYWFYEKEETQDRIRWFIKNSDYVTVATKHLYEKLLLMREGKPMEVISNAIDIYSFRDIENYPAEEPEKTIAWRGGETHREDLRYYEDAFINFSARTFDWKLHFWGDRPYRIMNKRPRMDWWPFSRNFYGYHYALKFKVKPFAVSVPLCDNEFNRAKSNIAAIEAIYAGAIPIIPAMPEWLPFEGALFYNNVKELEDRMMEVTEMKPQERYERWLKNLKPLMENYTLLTANQKRADVLQKLITPK